MVSERERVKNIMRNMARGHDIGYRLEFDPINKQVRPVRPTNCSLPPPPNPDGALNLSRSDADLFAEPSYLDGRLVVAAEILDDLERGVPKKVGFSGRPDEHVFQLLVNDKTHDPFPGTLTAIDDPGCAQNTALGCEDDQARLFVKWSDIEAGNTAPRALASNALGLVKTHNGWSPIRVEIIPVRQELFSRFGGLLETDALADSRVAIFGQGSGGSHISIELAKSGVGRFSLIDHDRLEVCNVARHHCDSSDIGRLKVQAMADAIRRKNPYVEVSVWPIKAKWDNFKTVREIVRDVDLVFAATDSHASKLLINKACFQEGRTCIFAGAHRRAHGGQVLRVRPGRSACLQCFAMLLPDQVQDQEISSEEQAEGLAYTDRPVPIEPGLSTDIAPISLMATKIGIQELLQDKPTTFRSLDQDLVADWYLWLNRREVGTQFENLTPMEFNVDGMHILRWYGIEINRHKGCPICGNFEANYSDEDLSTMLNVVKTSQMNPN